ncbi:hypothetical protein [Acetivibrio saccincola]|jgi:hypothetical protein|nr:hypothetical protein [Acetivibrio saccincola]HOA97142.1 hypothetical protein [Acetivibrio saccincola]HQD28771.1 hypothetical protein [Acetivibrio saccincola]
MTILKFPINEKVVDAIINNAFKGMDGSEMDTLIYNGRSYVP